MALEMIVPDPDANYIVNLFVSRNNNADPATTVGQEARLWWNPATNSLYVSDGVTPGGIAVGGGGSGGVTRIVAGNNITVDPVNGQGVVTINSTGGGNSTPGGPNDSIQFNNNGVFDGSDLLTFDRTTGTLTSSALNFANDLFIGGTLFTRTLTVGRSTTPVTVPLASNNSFNVLSAGGTEITVFTT